MHARLALALTLFMVVAHAELGVVPDEIAGAARVERLLRAQGLSPGRQPPAEELGGWSIEVRGTAAQPQLVAATCVPPAPTQPSFTGKRYRYESHNRGEWGGKLTVREGEGRERILLEENVVDMVPSGSDLYVFSGLDHGMDQGAVHVIEDFDSNPRLRPYSKLPGTPLVVGRTDDHVGGFLVVTQFSLTRLFGGDSMEVIMARHAPLRTANSMLAIGRSQILIGMCGGVARIQLPWYVHVPGADRDIPDVTYWTRP